MSDDEGRVVKVTTEEGEETELPYKVAVLSSKIKEIMEDTEEDEAIPLPDIKKETLDKIVEFANHHLEEPLPQIEKPLKCKRLRDILPDWYGEFITTDDMDILYAYFCAGNFLDFKPFVEITSAQIASLMRGKSLEEVRELLKVEDDFTEEERQQIIEENRW